MSGGQTSPTLSAFAHELAKGWQKLSLYQPGHPARAEVGRRLQEVLVALAGPARAVRLGVSRDAFLVPDDRIGGGPVGALAGALFDRGVALLRFDEGVGAEELESFLTLVPRSAPKEGEPPLWDRLATAGIERVVVEPADFSAVLSQAEVGNGPVEESRDGAPRALYEALIATLLADERIVRIDGEEEAEAVGSLDEVLRLVRRVLERHGVGPDAPSIATLTPAAAAALAALAESVGGAAGAAIRRAVSPSARGAAVRELGTLLEAIPSVLREGVLDAAVRDLATGEAGPEGLDELWRAVAPARVVASLRRLRAERARLSASVVGVVEDLALEVASRPAERIDLDGGELTTDLRRLLAEEESDGDLDRAAAAGTRDRIALELQCGRPGRVDPERFAAALDSIAEPEVTLQLCRTLLDLVQSGVLDAEARAAVARSMQQAVETLLASGRLASAVRLVHALRALATDPGTAEPVRRAAGTCLDRLARRDVMAALVEAVPTLAGEPAGAVGQLLELLGALAVRELLVAMCEESDLGRRRQTFDLVLDLGPAVAPAAVALIEDERWFVVRNMLALLRRTGDTIPGPALRHALEHPDARVRLEAVKSLGSAGEPVGEAEIRALLADPDPKVAESAARAVGALRLAAGRAPLLALLRRTDPLGRQTTLRCAALAALGELGSPEALDELGHFFRGWLTVVTPDERRAAFAALAGYPPDARAPWLEKGLRSPDPEVRETCRRLAGEGDR